MGIHGSFVAATTSLSASVQAGEIHHQSTLWTPTHPPLYLLAHWFMNSSIHSSNQLPHPHIHPSISWSEEPPVSDCYWSILSCIQPVHPSIYLTLSHPPTVYPQTSHSVHWSIHPSIHVPNPLPNFPTNPPKSPSLLPSLYLPISLPTALSTNLSACLLAQSAHSCSIYSIPGVWDQIPASLPSQLCDFGQVTQPVWASVSSGLNQMTEVCTL